MHADHREPRANRSPSVPAATTPGMVGERAAPADPEGALAGRLEPVGGLLDGDVAGLDLVDHRGVLGRRADGLRLGGQVALGAPERVGGLPHAALVERGQHLDGLAAVAARGQVGGAEAHRRVERRAESRPRWVEEVAAAVVVRELGGDVTGPVDVDDPRCRPVVGRNTARWRPLRSSSSRCRPGRLPPRAPISSPTRPSRSTRPIPATTVSRGCRSRVRVFSPASITRRSTRMAEDRRRAPDLKRIHGPNDPGQIRQRARERVGSVAGGCGGRGSPEPRRRRGSPTRAATRRRRATTSTLAGRSPRRVERSAVRPLSSVVEHFHGKEGVVGSIPTEGSVRAPEAA